jgi:demethylmenaquinone methyltransferase / 2-methoxy-6-polyprenyl-1,4-benzoquinol methylase
MRSYSLRSDSVRELFNAVAPRYDFLNHLLSLRRDIHWRKMAVRELGGGEALILDVATGTGDLAIETVQNERVGKRVVGLDFSKAMLGGAADKIRRRKLGDAITLMLGDGLRLPFRENTFDAAMIGFGLRNIPEKEQALCEMTRVVRPGGKILVLEFTLPRHRAIRALYTFYFLNILPRVGGIVSGNRAAYSYLPESVFRFQSHEYYEDLMRRAGLERVASHALTRGIASIMAGVKKQP